MVLLSAGKSYLNFHARFFIINKNNVIELVQEANQAEIREDKSKISEQRNYQENKDKHIAIDI